MIIKKGEAENTMGWKENKKKYIVEFTKATYHRVTIQLRADGKKERDLELWEAIKDAPSKQEALKELAYRGLRD